MSELMIEASFFFLIQSVIWTVVLIFSICLPESGYIWQNATTFKTNTTFANTIDLLQEDATERLLYTHTHIYIHMLVIDM